MRLHTLTALLLAGLSAPALAAAPFPIVKAPAIDVALMKDTVKTLSADDFEGRGPSTAVEPKVLDAIISRFAKAGLKPGGEKGGWLQEVPTVEMSGQNYSPLSVGGLNFERGKDFVAVSFRHVEHTAVKDAPLVFVGYGINAPELGWNDYAGLDMKGKVAVILVNDPDYADADEKGLFKGRRMTYYGRWTYKFEEAARQGATGALIIHDTFPAAYGWNVVQSSWTGSQYHVARPDNAMGETAFNGWVQQDVARQIFAKSGKDYAALVDAAKHKGFKPVALDLTANLTFDSALRRALSHNVVGIQKGKTRPDEVVLYSAHWDHLGHCEPDKTGDDICNGAVDNATGVGALTALAAANVKTGPAARSQVFVALTLEESGLLGSEFYGQNPLYPLAKTVGGVNMDALSPVAPARNYAATGGDKSDLTAYFRQVLKRNGLYESGEDHTERGHYYRSDHFSLAKRGVPMFDIARGTDLVKGGKKAGEAASQDYTDNRYHQPSDEYSPKWDWSGITQDVKLFYQLGRGLADSALWPNWHKGDEFRSIRDASLKAGK